MVPPAMSGKYVPLWTSSRHSGHLDAPLLPGTRHFQQGRPLCLRVRSAPGGGALLLTKIASSRALSLLLPLPSKATPVAGPIMTPAIFQGRPLWQKTPVPASPLGDWPSDLLLQSQPRPPSHATNYRAFAWETGRQTDSDRHRGTSKMRPTRPATLSRPFVVHDTAAQSNKHDRAKRVIKTFCPATKQSTEHDLRHCSNCCSADVRHET